jgi:hypothetical protein
LRLVETHPPFRNITSGAHGSAFSLP